MVWNVSVAITVKRMSIALANRVRYQSKRRAALPNSTRMTKTTKAGKLGNPADPMNWEVMAKPVILPNPLYRKRTAMSALEARGPHF